LLGQHIGVIDLSESYDVISPVTIRLAIRHFLLLDLGTKLSPTFSEMFNFEGDAIVDMTLNDL